MVPLKSSQNDEKTIINATKICQLLKLFEPHIIKCSEDFDHIEAGCSYKLFSYN